MEVRRHEEIEKDLKGLRKFAGPRESLVAWERLFYLKGIAETPGIDPFPGFGDRKIYKGRVVPLGENVGKSKGYRVIFELLADDNCEIVVFSRHGAYRSEEELMTWIRERLR